jgi:hypothetical protein
LISALRSAGRRVRPVCRNAFPRDLLIRTREAAELTLKVAEAIAYPSSVYRSLAGCR